MKKNYLLTPGPTPIPESVLSVFGQPIIHHRTPAFQTLLEQVRSDLKYLYQTKQEVLILSSQVQGRWKPLSPIYLERGDKVITINGGKFGERWTFLAKALRPKSRRNFLRTWRFS